MKNVLNPGDYVEEPPRVVEIIGPAGVGKTTLAMRLTNHSEQFRLGKFPNVRKVSDAPFFIWYGLQLVPFLFHLNQRNSRHLSRRELAWMVILIGWPDVLQRELKRSSQVMLLDQGPIYLFSELIESGPECLKSQNANKFFQELYCRWAVTLDLIVRLDAEDASLLERINTRTKEHIVKNEPSSVAYNFLDRFRKTYDQVVSEMGSCKRGPRVLKFNTTSQRLDEIADYLIAELART